MADSTGNSSTNQNASSTPSRRVFLWTATVALGGAAVWAFRRSPSHTVEASSDAVAAGPVTAGPVSIVQFSPDGKRLGTRTVPRTVKTDAEWKQQLSSTSFNVTRHEGTEIAYTGDTWNEHNRGIFRCICCDTALFSSETKFDSGTGWPSFYQPIAKENIREIRDESFGMARTAIACSDCLAHLGHVFDDGPPPTGLRYCMNSASMRFVKLA